METDLFTYAETIGPRHRAGDPATSVEAGDKAAVFLNAHHKEILRVLRKSGVPMAAEEIADAGTLKSHVAVNRRLPELADFGLIRRTEDRHINRSGRGAFKYRLVREKAGG